MRLGYCRSVARLTSVYVCQTGDKRAKSMESKNSKIFVGNIIHAKSRSEIEIIQDGYLIVENSKIKAIGAESNLNNTLEFLGVDKTIPVIKLSKTQILIPGFVDTHIHAPQYPNCGLGYDKTLLDWLNTYTYPLESRYEDTKFSNKVYKSVVKRSIECGTTTACYFGSMFLESSTILVDTVLNLGQRALIGKINMTKNAPDNYKEDPVESLDNTKKFIDYVFSKKSNMVRPIITPRFALSLDLDLMSELGALAKSKNLHIQTHISEQKDEVKCVRELFGMDYANVYDETNLLTEKTILAHGIHLSENEMQLIASRGASISHCPDSNLCLKSGNLNVRKLWDHSIAVGLGTDISGGPHPSIVRAMQACLYVSMCTSLQMNTDNPLNFEEVFYIATLGGAEALALDSEIGNFDVGKEFDALVIDVKDDNGLDTIMDYTPREILQKFVYSGDDRNISAVYIAGKCII